MDSPPPNAAVLSADFYRRDVLKVARDLLGRHVVSTCGGRGVRARIFEVEAYHQRERGAHCYGGKRTRRTEVMFRAGGVAYVYFVYGMHWQFNVVTGPAEEGQAVLIRGAVPMGDDAVLAEVRARRGWVPGGRTPTRRVLADPRRWCDGPAKLCQALAIDGACDGIPLDGTAAVWLEQGAPVEDLAVTRGPRIGIDYAGADARLPWRFVAE